jgi:hypothetical protein
MNNIKTVLLGWILLSISACGGGDSGGGNTDVTLTGIISAPSGAIAQLQPQGIKSMLANALFGKQVTAVTTGWTGVGGGVTVELIQVDTSGAQVGSAIATTTTNSDGSYSLTLPDGFTGGPEYVVRVGSGTTVMDSRVPVSSGSLDVDPGSDAASDLVTDVIAAVSGQLSDMSIDELQTLMDETENAEVNIDYSAYTDISGFSGAILDSVKNDEEKANVLYSSVSSGQICGTVTDSNGTALQNILVLVRDYGNWVTRAKTKTDASGNYCLNVPKAGDTDPFTGNTVSGEYILGAINRTSLSYAASEWWTSGGGANNQFAAEKVSVGATQVTKDFSLLADGARIAGTVQGYDGGYAKGVKVIIREYDTFKPLVSARVKADGSYRVNVKPGDYLISYRNNTRVHPYASEVYSDKHQRNQADRVTVAAGDNGPYDANLEAGGVIKGTVYTDSGMGTVAVGTIVTINDPTLSGSVERMRTNKKGKFRMWVQNGVNYNVNARGYTQSITPTASSSGIAFATDVAEITGKLVSDVDGSTPVSELFVRISPWNSSTNKISAYISQDSAAEDGSFTLYAPVNTDGYVVYARADSDVNYGSGVFDGTNIANTTYGEVTPITITSGEVGASGTGHALSTNIHVPTLGVGSGVGYLAGDGFVAATSMKIIDASAGGTDKRLTTTATRGDGTFKVTLPAGTYTVKRGSDGTVCPNVSVINGATTNVTFDASGCVP